MRSEPEARLNSASSLPTSEAFLEVALGTKHTSIGETMTSTRQATAEGNAEDAQIAKKQPRFTRNRDDTQQ